MSQLHPSDHKALLRAGFTEREIATQQRKFYNLTQIQPCYTDELKQFEQLQADRRTLLDALGPFVLANSSEEFVTLVVRSGDIAKARAAIANATGAA